MQKGQTGRCCRQRSDLWPDTCDTSAGTNAALKTTSGQHVFFPTSAYSKNRAAAVFASPALSRQLGGLLSLLFTLLGENPAGRLSSMWLESEAFPNHKYTSSFAWTDKTAPRFPGGCTCIHNFFFSMVFISHLNLWLRNLDLILPLEKVILSCHSGFLWTPGCWSTVGLAFEPERMRYACCC